MSRSAGQLRLLGRGALAAVVGVPRATKPSPLHPTALLLEQQQQRRLLRTLARRPFSSSAAAAEAAAAPPARAARYHLWAAAAAAALVGGAGATAAAAAAAPSAAEDAAAAALRALAEAAEAAAGAARLAYLIPTRLARDAAAAAAVVSDYRSELSRADAEVAAARAAARAARRQEGGDADAGAGQAADAADASAAAAAARADAADAAVARAEAARRLALKRCHQRGADRLLRLCFDNGGVYVKLGQHVGQLDHLLPEEYVSTMRRHLLDRCPVSPYDDVARLIERDLGAPPERVFASFNCTPAASASLAQVHEATLRPDPATGAPGRRVAVKVQHPGLRESCAADIAMISFLARAARAVFPDFDLQWLVDEVEHNLPLELDFRHEAGNAARCEANLRSPRSRLGRGRVAVPRVLPELSSARVLTMEWIEGAGLGDAEALDALGADRREVSLLVARTFNEMVFTFGDLHADPHAANLIVRRGGGGGAGAAAPPRPSARPATTATTSAAAREANEAAGQAAAAELAAAAQEDALDPGARRRRHLDALRRQKGPLQLVLLDHGLYRTVDDAFRLRYAALWRALIFADEAAIREHAGAMGAGHAVPLFAGMLTQRPWHAVVGSASQFEADADADGRPVAAGGGAGGGGGSGGGSGGGAGDSGGSGSAGDGGAASSPSPAPAPNELDGSYDPVAAANPAAAAALKKAAERGGGAGGAGARAAAGGLDRLSLPTGAEEREVLQAYAAHYGREIGQLLGKLPPELLLLLKTNDCLRSVDASLGNPVNTYGVTARECCRALAEARSAEAPGLRAQGLAAADMLGVEARMGAMAALSWWYKPRAAAAAGKGGGKTAAAEGGGGASGARPPPPPPPMAAPVLGPAAA